MATRHSRTLSAALATVVGAGLLLVPVQSASADTAHAARVGVLEGTRLYVKEGSIFDPWVEQADDVRKFQLEGDRIGVLRTNGQLDVKAGDLGPGWHTVNTDSVTDFQLNGDRIAYTEGTDLYITEGDFGGEIVHQDDAPVQKFQLAGDRVMVLTTDGKLKVKEGDLGPGWAVLGTGITDFSATDRHIVFLQGGRLYLREDIFGLNEPLEQARDVVTFRTESDRIVWLNRQGTLMAMRGTPYFARPVTISGSVTDFRLDGERIAYVENGDLWAQEGSLFGPSIHQENNIDSFDVDGDLLAVIKDGALLLKAGDLFPGWYVADDDSATAVELLAASAN
ncbi:hypothetical protein GCM10022243_56750 [Saccharothrix violaceirubra]|uniref:Uncharacterized protein n=1 Tax=Saccharothrix violaceirubra TaxID=413306 RepID=A0A7W7T3H4_9PSEU|nr:hypothetical protein [Saccharothrix violaceirubra]MBB4965893.1 hypothetical protein [Saccharothrix violaceirubra]